MMRLPSFEYNAPTGLAEALKMKDELGNGAQVLAGGTGLLVNLKHRLLSPAALISLKNIKELKGIEVRNDLIIIRAGTSLVEVAGHDEVRRHFPILVRAVESIGAVGIQGFRGTLGGNLCLQPRCVFYNQSAFWRTGKGSCTRTGGKECLAVPGSQSCQSVCSGDAVPALVAVSAQIAIAEAGGVRTIPIAEFFTGKGESPFNLAPNEIVTEIRLPIPWAAMNWSYQRIAMRAAVDYPLINAAAIAALERGKVESFRLVLSAVGPAPVVLRDIETAVKGRVPDAGMIDGAAQAAIKAAEGLIVDNSSVGKEYRINMAGVVAGRAVREALGL